MRIKEALAFIASFLKADTSTLSSGTAVDVNGAGKIAGIAVIGALAVGETVTVELYQADNSAGTNGVAISGAKYTFTATEAVTKMEAIVECHVTDLTDGYNYVFPKVKGTANTPVSVVMALGDNRFTPDNVGAIA